MIIDKGGLANSFIYDVLLSFLNGLLPGSEKVNMKSVEQYLGVC